MHHQTLKEVMGRDWWSGGVPLDYEIGLSKTDVMWDMISLGKSRTLRNCRDWKGENSSLVHHFLYSKPKDL